MVRAMHGPYPDVRFVPTGGIGPANLAAYLAQPNVVACGGSWLTEGVQTEDDLVQMGFRARAAAALVREARGAVPAMSGNSTGREVPR